MPRLQNMISARNCRYLAVLAVRSASPEVMPRHETYSDPEPAGKDGTQTQLWSRSFAPFLYIESTQ